MLRMCSDEGTFAISRTMRVASFVSAGPLGGLHDIRKIERRGICEVGML